jgi:hypothetical protein
MGLRDAQAERLVLAKGRSVSQASMRTILMARAVMSNSPAVSVATQTPSPAASCPAVEIEGDLVAGRREGLQSGIDCAWSSAWAAAKT